MAAAPWDRRLGEYDMDFETLFEKTPATIEEIRARAAYALERHPLCRGVQFDIVSKPRTSRGGNWTISLRSVAPDALWEASDIAPTSSKPTNSPSRLFLRQATGMPKFATAPPRHGKALITRPVIRDSDNGLNPGRKRRAA